MASIISDNKVEDAGRMTAQFTKHLIEVDVEKIFSISDAAACFA